MSKKRCAKCGRIYPSSYRQCPYCADQGGGRRSRPSSPPEQVLLFLQENRDRIFLACTAVFLLIAVLGIILTRCSVPEESSKPQEPSPPTGQQQDKDPPPEDPLPDPLTISQTTLTVYVGEGMELSVTGGSEDVPVWSSADESIATVTDGLVIGRAPGTVTVTASRGLEKVACTVTVAIKSPDVEVYLNRTDFTLRPKDPPFQMQVKVRETRKAYQGTVVWSVADPGVATVSETGLVTRVGRGTTVVTATMGEKVLECIVRVS